MHFRAQKKSSQDVSLSDIIETGNDGAALSLMDVVGEEPDLLETITSRERLLEVRRAVAEFLTDQEKHVVMLRFGIGGLKPCRQREVAQMLGISRSYVSRIEKRALGKLRKALEDKPAEAPKEPPRLCPFCKTEIHKEATRCPHCTSELK